MVSLKCFLNHRIACGVDEECALKIVDMLIGNLTLKVLEYVLDTQN